MSFPEIMSRGRGLNWGGGAWSELTRKGGGECFYVLHFPPHFYIPPLPPSPQCDKYIQKKERKNDIVFLSFLLLKQNKKKRKNKQKNRRIRWSSLGMDWRKNRCVYLSISLCLCVCVGVCVCVCGCVELLDENV